MKILEYLKKPAIAAGLAAFGGLVVGLVWGWVIDPVEWKDASPALLAPAYRVDYLRLVIGEFGETGDSQKAFERWQVLGSSADETMLEIMNNRGNLDPALIGNFASLMQAMSGSMTQTEEPISSTYLFGYLLIGVAILAIGGVGFAVYRLLRIRGSKDATLAMKASESNRQVAVTDYSATGAEPPIAQFVATYILGDDLFDDSFSIDSPAGEFMGECGVGISETIGVGEPKKVAAFEVWLFDKNDIQTVTKLVMSANAFEDTAALQRLEAKGEPVLAEKGKQIVLETEALQLVATIADMEYGEGALPANSYFGRLSLELAIWPKITAPE